MVGLLGILNFGDFMTFVSLFNWDIFVIEMREQAYL